MEIETPLLFKSTPEGASEFLVPTRRKGLMYALPQSPQQYKQLLMASGVHGYYQIARCFRDEDLRADRQPEFTQLDLEMSFASGQDIRRVVETVVQNVWSGVLDIPMYTLTADGKYLEKVDSDSPNAFRSLSYNSAISRFGIDKPDLRSSLEIIDLSDSAKAIESPEYPIIEALVIRPEVNGSFTQEQIDFLSDEKSYKARIPKIALITESDLASIEQTVERILPPSVVNITDKTRFYRELSLQTGDIVAFSTRQQLSYENPTPLGRFRQLAIEQFPNQYLRTGADGQPLITPDDFVATWVDDFPLFNPVETTQPEVNTSNSTTSTRVDYPKFDLTSYVSTHHPFTMVHMDDYELLSTAPLQARGQHYDLVINGVEVGGGSTRIHDTKLQKYIFEEILNITNSKALFGHLLEAFDTGCPPHAGLAIGFDRMTAMLSRTSSIRDVIAFPKTITGADPLIGSPSKVKPSQLGPYHIRTM
ncbi:aspartate--tRNA ligase MSD1 [Sugiyamaella lignohabitans]|uniref:Aspartate--tRNA ligase MSD1 n=1 Tax=Sugiyamaella lignohabitans TaxID=796027 RepID=A0A167ECQ3_9ASCO|nr:aspartate--tRNA ligase MSD1 [Sugiyamaella lignohabitans]ANB13912.1 aspartate--tRNA ligase MSD1 [Sugiyamaella lignohabitans]